MGPTSDVDGGTTELTCASSLETATIGQWVCEHRDPSLRNMVAFRKVVGGSDVNHWWDDGANAIAFTRGNKGFVAINGAAGVLLVTVTTGMAPGNYTNLIAGDTVVVDSIGRVQVNLAAKSALAIDTATRLP